MCMPEVGKENQQNMNRRLEKDVADDEGEEGTGYKGTCSAAGQSLGGELTSLYLSIVEFI